MKTLPQPIAIVGGGRLGTALTAALHAVGVHADGPFGRGADLGAPAAVLLCVPDRAIAEAAAAIAPGPLVGHCAGAVGLDVLHPHEAFAMHPLTTVAPSFSASLNVAVISSAARCRTPAGLPSPHT